MTTHRALFDEADAALARTAVYAANAQKVSVAEGEETARQHNRLIAALTRHLEYLHGNTLTGMTTSGQPTAREAATSALVAALRRTSPNDPGEAWGRTAVVDSAAAVALAEATDRIRLATDVLATHHRPGEGPRTPDGQQLDDPDARWAVTTPPIWRTPLR